MGGAQGLSQCISACAPPTSHSFRTPQASAPKANMNISGSTDEGAKVTSQTLADQYEEGTHKPSTRTKRGLKDLWNDLAGYVFVAPGVGGLALFFLFPLLFAFVLSLMNVSLLHPDDASYKGFANYAAIFDDPVFVRSLINTIVYAAIQTPLQTFLGLALALLIQKKTRGITFFRSAFYMPVVISMVVAAVIWKIAYAPNVGLINSILGAFGIPAQPFLSSASQALPAIAGMLAWKWVGFSMIIFLAGLQTIPDQMYEAAKIDGAGPLQRFRNVTLPLLKRTMLFVVVINTINSFKLFTPIILITQGGPQESTTVLVYYIYKQAFHYYHLGIASAGAVVLFLIVLAVLLVQFRLFRSDVEY